MQEEKALNNSAGDLQTSWKNKNVVVTGANGFVGSHLVEALLALGAQVTAIVRRASGTQITHQFHNLQSCLHHPMLTIKTVDLTGPDALECLLRTDAPIWFHLAADAYVPASLTQPTEVVHTNVMSTMIILEAARKKQTEIYNVVMTSSSEVYGSYPTAISEEYLLNPTTPYGASKAACDRLAWSYVQSFHTPLTIVRPFNTYGPRHVYDVVPLFIRAALSGQPLTIHGDGKQTRDLTYVTDTVAAFLAIGERPGTGEIFNIGTGQDISVLQMAKDIKEATASTSSILFDGQRPGEVQKLQANSSQLQTKTHWHPQICFEKGVKMNVDWAMQNPAALHRRNKEESRR